MREVEDALELALPRRGADGRLHGDLDFGQPSFAKGLARGDQEAVVLAEVGELVGAGVHGAEARSAELGHDLDLRGRAHSALIVSRTRNNARLSTARVASEGGQDRGPKLTSPLQMPTFFSETWNEDCETPPMTGCAGGHTAR